MLKYLNKIAIQDKTFKYNFKISLQDKYCLLFAYCNKNLVELFLKNKEDDENKINYDILYLKIKDKIKLEYFIYLFKSFSLEQLDLLDKATNNR